MAVTFKTETNAKSKSKLNSKLKKLKDNNKTCNKRTENSIKPNVEMLLFSLTSHHKSSLKPNRSENVWPERH